MGAKKEVSESMTDRIISIFLEQGWTDKQTYDGEDVCRVVFIKHGSVVFLEAGMVRVVRVDGRMGGRMDGWMDVEWVWILQYVCMGV